MGDAEPGSDRARRPRGGGRARGLPQPVRRGGGQGSRRGCGPLYLGRPGPAGGGHPGDRRAPGSARRRGAESARPRHRLRQRPVRGGTRTSRGLDHRHRPLARHDRARRRTVPRSAQRRPAGLQRQRRPAVRRRQLRCRDRRRFLPLSLPGRRCGPASRGRSRRWSGCWRRAAGSSSSISPTATIPTATPPTRHCSRRGPACVSSGPATRTSRAGTAAPFTS